MKICIQVGQTGRDVYRWPDRKRCIQVSNCQEEMHTGGPDRKMCNVYTGKQLKGRDVYR